MSYLDKAICLKNVLDVSRPSMRLVHIREVEKEIVSSRRRDFVAEV